MMLKTIGAAALLLAAQAHAGDTLQQPPAPHQRQTLPPTAEQSKFDLAPTRKPRNDLMPRNMKASMSMMSATPACKDMNTLAGYSGAALAEYVANLPDYECTYPLFSAAPALASPSRLPPASPIGSWTSPEPRRPLPRPAASPAIRPAPPHTSIRRASAKSSGFPAAMNRTARRPCPSPPRDTACRSAPCRQANAPCCRAQAPSRASAPNRRTTRPAPAR